MLSVAIHRLLVSFLTTINAHFSFEEFNFEQKIRLQLELNID